MRTWSHSGGIPNYELPRTPPRWLRQRLPDRVSRRDGSDFVQQFDQEGGIEKTGFHLREIRSRESPVRLAARPAASARASALSDGRLLANETDARRFLSFRWIFIVAAWPGWISLLVPTLWCQIKVMIGSEEHVETPREGGVR